MNLRIELCLFAQIYNSWGSGEIIDLDKYRTVFKFSKKYLV